MSRWILPAACVLALALADSATAHQQFSQCSATMPAAYVKKPAKPACMIGGATCSAEETARYQAAMKQYREAQKQRLAASAARAGFNTSTSESCGSQPLVVVHGYGFDE